MYIAMAKLISFLSEFETVHVRPGGVHQFRSERYTRERLGHNQS